MKINLIVVWLMFILLISCTIDSYSQYFLAGEHGTSNYYVNIDPDTTLIGPDNTGGNPSPAITFQIDINGDGIKDFYLYSYGFRSNGSGKSELSIRTYNKYENQIALGYYDTCHKPNSYYSLFALASSLKMNDTINENLSWTDEGKLYLTYSEWYSMVYGCAHNSFANNYIAVRMLRPNDTLYGWIKVANINFLTITVQEYACNKNCIGIPEHSDQIKLFPVPTNNNVNIETQFQDFDLIIYNQYGMETMKKKLVKGNNSIELSSYASGVYIFKLLRNNSIIIKKVIKQ